MRTARIRKMTPDAAALWRESLDRQTLYSFSKFKDSPATPNNSVLVGRIGEIIANSAVKSIITFLQTDFSPSAFSVALQFLWNTNPLQTFFIDIILHT